MTERQTKFFKKIIEIYIETGEPVGSKSFLKKTNVSYSSATIRNEMMALEKEGYLEKSHTSSGRIPSIKGYKHYAKNLTDDSSKDIENKLHDIFAKRRTSIDFTIEEAAKSITDMAGLTLVTSNSENDELMKSIQLTPINDKMATIVIVTSAGRVESKVIDLNNKTNLQDVRIAVRLFKERLVDTKLKDLGKKVEMLSPILAKSIKNYETLIQAFVGKVFDFHKNIQNKVYGSKNIIKSDIKRDDLVKLLDLIQNKSVFSAIEGKLDEDKNMKIEIRPNNTSLISSKIKHNNRTTEVSIVGSNRMDYTKAKKTIALLKELLGGNE